MQSHEDDKDTDLVNKQFDKLAVTEEIFYHVPWRVRGVQAGSHRTNLRGTGNDFSAFVSLMQHPDPKRLDVRSSLKTVPRQLMVKTFFERSAIKAFVVNDLSSSMRFSGKLKKCTLLTQITQAIAWSVVRQGDYFAMVSCHDRILDNVSIALTYRPSVANDVHRLLMQFFSQPEQVSNTASGMPLVAEKLGTKKSLLFLISDFYWPDHLLEQTFQAFGMHDVVPIVLWDQSEFETLPDWGWAKLVEMETGQQRSLFMRPALHQRMREHAEQRKQKIRHCCQLHGARLPFFVTNGFDATALSRHLLGY